MSPSLHQTAAGIAAQHGVTKSAGRHKESGSPIFALRCPLVESKSGKSVHIWDGGDGFVALDDKHPCDNKAVRDALGIRHKGSGGPPPPLGPRPKQAPEPSSPQSLPSGPAWWEPWIYTDAAGTPVLAVVRLDLGQNEKTGRMRKEFLQFTPAPDDPGLWLLGGMEGQRPLYRLGAIVTSATDKAIIVEGEKCADSGQKAWPTDQFTTFAGGVNAWAHTDYEPLRELDVDLISDDDEGSHKSFRQLAYFLDTEYGCTVRLAQPEVGVGDVADWIERDGAEAAAAKVADLLVDYDPDLADKTEPPNPPKPPIDGDIVSNPHYRLLGLAGEQVAFWVDGQVMLKTRESLMKVDTLYALARSDFLYRLAETDIFASQAARRVGDSLIRCAIKIGQVDLTAVTGRGAFRLPNGMVGYHLGDRLLVDGEITPLARDYSLGDESPDPFTGRYFVAEPRIELATQATEQQMRDAAKALMAYRWSSPPDASLHAGRRMLGWIVAATIGGALEWRPHLMFTAPAESGKTFFLDQVVHPILGFHVEKTHDATIAGVTRYTRNSGLPILIDEAEPTADWVQELFKLLRGAAGGNSVRMRAEMGTSDGVQLLALRTTALMAATALPTWARADESRWTMVTFGDEVDDWPTVQAEMKAAMKHADAIRSRIIRHTPQIIAAVEAKVAEYQRLGMGSREAMASAALTAGWQFWGLDSKEVYSTEPERSATDGAACLQDILALEIRLDNGTRTVQWILANGNEMEIKQLTSRLSIRLDEGTGFEGIQGLAIKNDNPGLREAMKNTSWGRVNLRQKLLEIPGAVLSKSSVRFPPALRGRAVLLPLDALDKVGIGFDYDHPQGS